MEDSLLDLLRIEDSNVYIKDPDNSFLVIETLQLISKCHPYYVMGFRPGEGSIRRCYVFYVSEIGIDDTFSTERAILTLCPVHRELILGSRYPLDLTGIRIEWPTTQP